LDGRQQQEGGERQAQIAGAEPDHQLVIDPPRLPLTLIDAVYAAPDGIRLMGFPGAAFRGAFGAALWQLGCRAPEPACQPLCCYHFLFETPARGNGPFGRGILRTPRPFVLKPPPGNRRIEPGGTLRLRILLIGDAFEHLTAVMAAIAAIDRIDGPAPTTVELLRLDCERPAIASTEIDAPEEIALEFDSPTILRSAGRDSPPAPFRVMFGSVLRRINMLAGAYTAGWVCPDPRLFLQASCGIETRASSLRLHHWERHSRRQEAAIPMRGWIGRIVFGGSLAPFWPWLLIGESVGVGSGTTFGMGSYKITRPPTAVGEEARDTIRT
jgi:hypothetical protein